MKFSHLLLLGLLAFSAQAAELGQQIDTWTLPDQFDEPYQLDNEVRIILIASSTEAARIVDAAIKEKPEGYLPSLKTVYIADITHVPRMVANFVLVPSMRDANYRILLDREGEVASQYATDSSEVLWLSVEDGVLRGREHFSSANQLRDALDRELSTDNP